MTGLRERTRVARAIVAVALAADAPRALLSTALTLVVMAQGLAVAFALKVTVGGVVRGSPAAVLAGAALAAAATAASLLAGSTAVAVRLQVREKTTHELAYRMTRAAASAPTLEHFERPDYHNEVDLARAQRAVMAGVLDALTVGFAVTLQILATVAVLASVDPWLLLAPLLALPGLALVAPIAAMSKRLGDEQAEPARVMAHLLHQATTTTAASEARIYGLQAELLQRRRRLWENSERRRLGIERRILAMRLATIALFAAGYGTAITLLVVRTARGDLPLDAAVLGLTLAAQTRNQIASLQQTSGQLVDALVAGSRYLWIIDHAEQAKAAMSAPTPVDVPARLREGIRLEHVSFTYPGTTDVVLRDVDVRLPAGSTVAIVGENGAGKTTLVKLLARAYDPTAGAINIDGVDLKELRVEEWRQRLSGAFQDFVRFELIAAETVGVGDLARIDDQPAIAAAVERGGATPVVDDLPDGLSTPLGRSFEGGVELSGGQWQKLALSRANMRESPLVLLLDEPTANLDAAAEDAVHRSHIAARDQAVEIGGLTVIVSHRFSTVRMADLILVLDDGHLIEAGSHDELVAKAGLYAELFTLQAKPYQTATTTRPDQSGAAMGATTAAANAIRQARREAKDLNSRQIGQEHLLLAITASANTDAAVVLARLGIDPLDLHHRTLGSISRGPAGPAVEPEPTPRTRLAIQEAADEADDQQRCATTADLLVGMLRAGQGVGYQLLEREGLTLDGLRQTVLELIEAEELEGTVESNITSLLDEPDHAPLVAEEGPHEPSQGSIVVFSGPPGVGKSSIADEVARRSAIPAFSFDWLVGSLTPLGIVGPDHTVAVGISLLLTLAARQLALGQSAILDGPFFDAGTRSRIEELAERHHARLDIVECACPDLDEHRRRVYDRRRGIPGWRETVPWPEVEARLAEHVRWSSARLALDTTTPLERNVEAVLELLGTTASEKP